MRLPDVFNKVHHLYNAKAYDEALALIEAWINQGNELAGDMLVVRGRLIQLADHSNLTLEQAKESFLSALALNSNDVDALMELAWLHLNVFDSPNVALKYFLDAKRICEEKKNEIERGLAACLSELPA